MYPSIVDMSKNESSKCLRMLELDAYANVLAALRAQGPPTSEKLKLLKDIGTALRIPQERCKAEIRKVILDERLNTIAYFSCGQFETADEWIKEGRRLISLMPRMAPHTIYSAIADEVADAANTNNEQLPLSIDHKRAASVSQVQQNVPDIKSQPFRIPETFKCDEIKKRKIPFGVENSSLAQHLIAPSKISRIQQIYRQKVKAKVKEQQFQSKLKQDQEQELRLQQSKVFPQQPRIQKLPLSVQPSASTSPKINILQNISIQPSNRGEETIEQIKNEVNSFLQKSDQNRTSPQPGCSNENQAPKQKLVNIKSTVSYKHIANPGPSSDLQKLKVCPARKAVKTVPGQKLIIVSNAQSIANSSILQRTLTIPFVKNISVKNFDKFKIVSTNASTMLGSLTANSALTNSAKHKVVTVRTNPTTKKMIPLAHLQALNAKGGIKMLPVGGKILTKTSSISTTPPLYIMNSMGSIPAATKSTSSTPLMVTCRPQESFEINTTKPNENGENDSKSSVLADILKASGVIESDDVESQIKQFAIIPQGVTESIGEDVQPQEYECENENIECIEDVDEGSNNVEQCLILSKEDNDTERLLKDLEGEDSSEAVIGNLDPGTGEYTIEANASHTEEEIETSESPVNEESFNMEKSIGVSDIHAVN